ncbi:MAG TPA: dUTP diphosphatase [Candidatus Sulfotelmatobacter sp.]|nr:dUTP diphosphatase [Candidatus Sulfotelmatobacter sp.]
MERLEVLIQRLPHARDLPLPAYETSGAAGLDVRAAVDQPVTIEPGAIARIPTGFALEVPAGFEMQIRPRSGLASRLGLTLANSPATIDSDYRGEVVIALIHHGGEPMVIERGMRIAQMVLARVPRVSWQEVDELTPSSRGTGGFGHTGIA